MPVGPCCSRRFVGCLTLMLIIGQWTAWTDLGSGICDMLLSLRDPQAPPLGMRHVGISAARGQEMIPAVDILGGGASAGIRLQRPGRWTAMAVEAQNTSSETALLKVAYFFRENPSRQFSRRIWVPPHSRRMVLCPMLVPESDPFTSHEVVCTVTDITTGTPRLLPDAGGALQRTSLLASTADRMTTVTFPEEEASEESMERNEEASRAIVAARLAGDHARRVTDIYRWLLPDHELFLDAMDQFVITDTRTLADVAFVDALRQWLFQGGTLWIMLDRTGCGEVAKLLGSSWQCAEVGRVDLTDFEFQPELSGLLSGGRREFEQPVEMLRVVLDNARVFYRVDGWPAAFSQPFGRGRIIFTTVAAPGWIRPAMPSDARRQDPAYRADHLAVPELVSLSSEMFAPRPRDPVASEDWQRYLAQRIGYQIVPRRPIQWILGSFLITLAVSAHWLRRRGMQPRLAVLAPVLALLVAVPIAGWGLATQRSVPDTVATGQMIQVVPHQETAHVRGTVAFYHQSPSMLEAASTGGGYFIPELGDQDGTIQEMIWSDMDQWEWANVRVHTSIHTGSFAHSLPLESPCHVDATFGPAGLEGRLVGGGWRSPEDPVVLAPVSRGLVVTWGDEGEFQARSEDLLGPLQFVGSQLLSDEQQRRQELMRAIHERRGRTGFPHVPSLLFWTDPVASPFQFSSRARRTGSALVQVPITLRRPASGTQITIPSTFLPYRLIPGPGGRGIAATYQPLTGEWMGSERGSQSWVRVRIPEILRPLNIEKLRIQLNIHAPGRLVEIAVAEEGEARVLLSRNQPSGVLNLDIDRAEFLQPDEEGGLLFGLLVGETAGSEINGTEWKVQDLQMTVEGRVE